MATKEREYTLGEVVSESTLGNTHPGALVPTTGPKTMAEIFRNSLDEEYPEIIMTETDAKRIGSFIANIRQGGSSGVRLVCAGDRCDYCGACELFRTKVGEPTSVRDPQTGRVHIQQETLAPAGKTCPLEAVVVMETRSKYQHEFEDVDCDEAVKQQYISDLCQIAMLEWRCNMLLGFDHHGVTQTVPGAVTSDGKVVWKQELSPIIEMLDKLSTRRSRLFHELVKSPRERYKKEHAVGRTGGDSLSRAMAAKREKLRSATQGKDIDALPVPEGYELPGGSNKDED